MSKAGKITFLCTSLIFVLFACQKWKDPAAQNLGLTNPYCNDPNAVNYNWGFPGRPDDSICFYPSNVFMGKYVFQDSAFLTDNTYLSWKVDTLYIYALTETKIAIVGFCNSTADSVKLTAYTNYTATIDTDATLLTGQQLCTAGDTVNGTVIYDQADTGIYQFNFTVYTDTGAAVHIGNAVKI